VPLHRRVPSFFLWCSDLDAVVASPGSRGEVEFCGVDCLLAYWMLRASGLGGRRKPLGRVATPFDPIYGPAVTPESQAPPPIPSPEEELARIVRVIAERFDPEKILLFGSRAQGRAAPDSDADLLVVMRSNLPYYDRVSAVLSALWPHDLPLDLLVFTPEEAGPLQEEPFSFVGEILRTGKVLYQRRAA
jgi:predicted nucleotidyltransferase